MAEFPDRSLAEIPRGPFPQQIIEETEEDLNEFVDVLEKQGVTVKRPETWPHDANSPRSTGKPQGYYNYCPRDVLLVVGDQIIETPNVIRSRCPGDVQLSHAADGLSEVGRKVVQRAQAHAAGLARSTSI